MFNLFQWRNHNDSDRHALYDYEQPSNDCYSIANYNKFVEWHEDISTSLVPAHGECLSHLLSKCIRTYIHVSQPCLMHNDTGMACETPKLQLPSKEKLSSDYCIAKFRLVFTFKENKDAEELDRAVTITFSAQIEVVELPAVEEQQWSPYDPVKREALSLKVSKVIHAVTESQKPCFVLSHQISWGAFQDQVEVVVGSIQSTIIQQSSNSILFYPPNEDELLRKESACPSPSHPVNVSRPAKFNTK
eukprot:GHVO01035070.1.p1 GENE.GHVO01035070.1~~GHVO01035070.1.p1  ORF type:complete len:246 (-),score=16.16 GHVO01035070.1:79-816(-)